MPKAEAAHPATGLVHLAQFEVIRRLGAGGMAEVFLAKKRGAEGTYKILVVKRILPSYGSSRRFRTMFVEEAQLATRLNHPNVVQVYDFFDEGGDVGQLLAMEYVEGPDLGRLMSAAKSKGTRIPPWVGAWVIGEAAKGLHYAHEKKDETGTPLEIVHRDVSPQNVLLSFDGTVKIADFGIASARLFDEEQGVIKGKYGYMSPEQARAEKVDRRGDLYALGVILWEILTGKPLHGGLGGEALLDIVRSGLVEPPSAYVPDLPMDLEAIVMKALAPRREDRHPTGRDMAGAIARALLARQELVDGSTLEATIAQLVDRDFRFGSRASEAPQGGGDGRALSMAGDDGAIRSFDQRTQAAVPLAISGSGAEGTVAPGLRRSLPSSTSEPPASLPPDALLSRRPLTLSEGPREVRHVAVVTLRVHGVDPREQQGEGVQRTLERLRSMLGEIAYKRRMRWVWTSDVEARAVAGLETNPTRAASDAAWLALDTHEAVEGFNEDSPFELAASIAVVRGIASGVRDPQGHLVRYQLHEPAPFLSDKLGHETPPSHTWVAGGVYRLVRREFRWGDAPALVIEPNAAVELPPHMRIYALERSLSREERLAETSHAPNDLVGRDAEKADLHAAYHEAVSGNAGSGQVTTRAVIGEMGIGKTALVATFLGELPPNARLVRVEASPARVEVPYSGVADLIRDVVGTTGDESYDVVVELVAKAGGGSATGDASNPMIARLAELATNRQAPGAADADEGANAHYHRKLLINGIRSLLAAIALNQPLVVVLEGLHWGDRASLDLFAEILRTPPPLPILILLVTRGEDRVMPLLQGIVRIELRGLAPEEQVRLLETRLGVREGVRQVCAELMPRVGGNPFFLLEMVDALLERGALEIKEVVKDGPGSTSGARDASSDATPETVHVLARSERAEADFQGLPSTLEQLLADRLTELPEEEHTVIDWLAIAAGPLAWNDLAKLMQTGEDEAIVRLCARGLCDRKGDLVDFRHPLTRDVAYAALDSKRRASMHLELGGLLADSSLARGLSAAIVARHLARGGDGERAADFYLEAAVAARTGYQTQLAVRYFQRALNLLPPDDPRRVVGHEALEAIYRMLGRRRERMKQLDALRKLAKRIGGPRTVALAFLRTARFHQDGAHLPKAIEVARNAAEIARSSGLAQLEVEGEALVSEILRELGDVQGALAACDRALAASESLGTSSVPQRARADVLRSRGVLLRRVGRVREAVDAYVDAIAVFKHAGALRQEAKAKGSLAYSLFVQGRYEDAISLALESIQIVLSIGGRIQLANPLCNIGHAYARLGDAPRALAYFKRARDAHERVGDQDSYGDTLIVSAEVLVELGEHDQAATFLGDASALNAETKNAYDLTHLAIVRSALARARGDLRESVEHAIVARRSAESQALVSFHFYGLALEAASRAGLGELHTSTLLATTALGAVETLQGCEYGLEIRVLCAHALAKASSPQAAQVKQRAVDYAFALMNTIRDKRFRRTFAARPLVATLFQTDETYCALPSALLTSGDPS